MKEGGGEKEGGKGGASPYDTKSQGDKVFIFKTLYILSKVMDSTECDVNRSVQVTVCLSAF